MNLVIPYYCVHSILSIVAVSAAIISTYILPGINNNALVTGAGCFIAGAGHSVVGASHFIGGADRSVGGAGHFVEGADRSVEGADRSVGGANHSIEGDGRFVKGADHSVAGAGATVKGAIHFITLPQAFINQLFTDYMPKPFFITIKTKQNAKPRFRPPL